MQTTQGPGGAARAVPHLRCAHLALRILIAAFLSLSATIPAAGQQDRLPRGVHVLPASEHLKNSSADRPFDLAGSSLVFAPAGGGYTMSRTEVHYDTDLGTLLHSFQPGAEPWHYAPYSLSKFTFPFAGSTLNEFFVYAWGGLFVSPPPLYRGAMHALMLAEAKGPVIAPFLLPLSAQMVPGAFVYVRESPDALQVTWKNDPWGPHVNDSGFAFDVQLVLRRDGTITFSYRRTGAITWPVVGLWAGGATLLPPLPGEETDLSAMADGITPHALPLAETFSVPSIDTNAIWAEVRAAFGYRDDEIDAVAIYQDFHTDLLYFAAAYCVWGNVGVDGLRVPGSAPEFGSAFPHRASTMHMGHVAGEGGYKLLLHEFGHRWLYYFSFSEAGVMKTEDGHPSFFTDTTAAFPTSPADHSPLGGSAWVDNGDGTFTSSGGASEPGFSWHELYFLGLATPEEVPPWFYIADPQFQFFRGWSSTYAGSRRGIDIASVIAANGPRVPAAATAPKHFRVVLVLIARNPEEVPPDVLRRLLSIRSDTEKRFAAATGGRGTLEFLPALPISRQRPARR